MNKSTEKAFELFKAGFEAAVDTLVDRDFTDKQLEETLTEVFDKYRQQLLKDQQIEDRCKELYPSLYE